MNQSALLLEQVRSRRPLVHHLTNWVTIAACADATAAIGAAPVMAHAVEEVEDMTALADALVLNIGTLTPAFVAAMAKAAAAANRKGIPVVLDVCGAGATPLRTQSALRLLGEFKIDVVKGNASEMAAVAGLNVQTRGVDTGKVVTSHETVARRVAARFCSVAVLTGPTDIVTGSRACYRVDNGHELLARVVGTGCMATSVIGAFAAVSAEPAHAAAAALACYGLAAELAAPGADGPASFKVAFLDALAALTVAQADTGVMIEAGSPGS